MVQFCTNHTWSISVRIFIAYIAQFIPFCIGVLENGDHISHSTDKSGHRNEEISQDHTRILTQWVLLLNQIQKVISNSLLLKSEFLVKWNYWKTKGISLHHYSFRELLKVRKDFLVEQMMGGKKKNRRKDLSRRNIRNISSKCYANNGKIMFYLFIYGEKVTTNRNSLKNLLYLLRNLILNYKIQ